MFATAPRIVYAHPMDKPDDDIEYVPIPMDRRTRTMLTLLAHETKQHPVDLAADLFADLLEDDILAHVGSGAAH